MIRRTLLIPVAVVFVGLLCGDHLLAHPGHGATPAEAPLHIVVEPIHGWPILLSLGLGIVVWRRRRSRA